MADLKNLFGNTVYCDFFNLAIAKAGGPIDEFNLSVRTKAGVCASLKLTEDDILALGRFWSLKLSKKKKMLLK